MYKLQCDFFQDIEWPVNGITEEQALTKCRSLETDTLVVQCAQTLKITLVTETVIDACVEDVKVGGYIDVYIFITLTQ